MEAQSRTNIKSVMRCTLGRMIDPRLDQRVVLVTGGNNPDGIGAGTAKAFAAQGARVFLHFFRAPAAAATEAPESSTPGEALYRRRQQQTADDVVKAIRAHGGTIEAWEADLSDPDAPRALFEHAEHAFGAVDILVNNAAHAEHDTFVPPAGTPRNRRAELATGRRPAPLSAQTFDRHFSVNTRAVALLIAEFARRLVARGASYGRVINVSTAGAYVFPSEVSYGASKLALEAYTRSAAVELGQFGITVNAVSLGPVQTGWISPELETALLSTIPLGRIGTPPEVADVIVFLASEQARWVTGQTLFVGGGHGM